jgi:hypothetical protein
MTHLREHFVDSPWAGTGTLGAEEFDSAGNLAAEPDTAHFDQWVRRWPDARQYCVAISAPEQFEGSRIGAPDFARKVGSWARFWAKHAEKCGLKAGQLVMLLVDEPTEAKQDQVILAWAAAIREAHTGIKIWEDPCHKDPAEANQDMMAACDVLCPNRVAFLNAGQSYRDYFVRQHKQGKELAFYSCSGPATLLDPCAYYRLQAWSCWQYGAKSSYFWSFGDAGGGSSWNEYAARGNTYVPFFLDSTSVTPGKQMEALREGVEDYEYLVMLKARIAAAERSGVSGLPLERARKLLNEAASRVCGDPGAVAFDWAKEKDRGIADHVRIEILDALTELR